MYAKSLIRGRIIELLRVPLREKGQVISFRLQELRICALVEGYLVLRGQAVSDGGSLSQLWQPILRSLLSTYAVKEQHLSILKPLLPDIESLLECPIPDAPPLGGQAGQQHLLTTIAMLFEQPNRPILLLLEDLHWVGDRLPHLKHLLKLVGQLPLQIVASYRDDEAPHLSDELPAMQSLKFGIVFISRTQNAVLVRRRLDTHPNLYGFFTFAHTKRDFKSF